MSKSLLLCFLLLGIRGWVKLANCWPRGGLGSVWGLWAGNKDLNFLLLPHPRGCGTAWEIVGKAWHISYGDSHSLMTKREALDMLLTACSCLGIVWHMVLTGALNRASYCSALYLLQLPAMLANSRPPQQPCRPPVSHGPKLTSKLHLEIVCECSHSVSQNCTRSEWYTWPNCSVWEHPPVCLSG